MTNSINTTRHSRPFSKEHLKRFLESDFGTPAEMLEHRLLAIPGIMDAEVCADPENLVVADGDEALFWVTVYRCSGYTTAVLDDVTTMITGPECCPTVREPIDEDLLEAV